MLRGNYLLNFDAVASPAMGSDAAGERSKSTLNAAGYLAGCIICLFALAGWVTHIVVCITTAAWWFLALGLFVFPVAILHGWVSWFLPIL
ncbi:1,4-dihydroxy-2-naphthoate octaprenyltransferase [Rhodoligotrophos appendicifer]|uniref:hypothetical protein n=1 Tax=Rhodoligotrophos appendicifer TaxID=987056 RepID=UPI001FE4FE8A|nr:hypothetical protein [Rhodoligotrophos appendicifer]